MNDNGKPKYPEEKKIRWEKRFNGRTEDGQEHDPGVLPNV